MPSRNHAKQLARLLAILSFLTSAVGAHAADGCRKQILLYLDVSGSMKPVDRSPAGSPFARTVEALDELMSQENMVQDSDVVELRLFGAKIEASKSARGRSQIRELIEDLRSNTLNSNLSNLVTVFENVTRALEKDNLGFDKRLVIIASDFVHESGRSTAADLQHWRENIRALEASRFRGDGKRAFLFLTLPALAEPVQAIRNEVLQDLSAQNPDSKIDLDSASPREIAAEIQKKLLFEPVVEARVESRIDDGTSPQLKVRVSNRNCKAVRLAEVSAKCGGRGDALPLKLPRQPTELGVGADQSFVDLQVELSAISCKLGDNIQVLARLEEGVTGNSTREASNLLEVRPFGTDGLAGEAESSLFRTSLNLFLDLKGQSLSPQAYEFALKRQNSLVAEGTFDLPRGLSGDWQTYLLPIEITPFEGDRAEFELEITKASLERSRVSVKKDTFESKLNIFFICCASVLLCASFYNGLFSASQRQVFRSLSQQLLAWLAPIVGTLSLLVYDFFRSNPMLTPRFENLKWLGLAAAFAVAAFLWLRQRRLREIDQQIEKLFRGSTNKDGEAQSKQPDLAAAQNVVNNVNDIVSRGGSGLQIVCWALFTGLVAAGLIYLFIYLIGPSTTVDARPVGVLKAVQR